MFDKPPRKYIKSSDLYEFVSNTYKIRLKESKDFLKNKGIFYFATTSNEVANIYKMLILDVQDQDNLEKLYQKNIKLSATSIGILPIADQNTGLVKLDEIDKFADLLAPYQNKKLEPSGSVILNGISLFEEENNDQNKVIKCDLEYLTTNSNEPLAPLRYKVYFEVIEKKDLFIAIIAEKRAQDTDAVVKFFKNLHSKILSTNNQRLYNLKIPQFSVKNNEYNKLIDEIIENMEDQDFEFLGITGINSKNPSGTGEEYWEGEQIRNKGLNIREVKSIIDFLIDKQHRLNKIYLAFFDSDTETIAFDVIYDLDIISKFRIKFHLTKEIDEKIELTFDDESGSFSYKKYKELNPKSMSEQEAFKLIKNIMLAALENAEFD